MSEVWVATIILSVLGGLAWRARWFIGLAFTFVATLPVLGMYWELTDPYVGPAIRAEAGTGHVVHCGVAAVALYCGHAVGAISKIRERKHRR